MTRPTDALRLVPSRDDGLTVGRAILEAHSQWEKEHGVTGAQNPWQEQHITLLGQAAILAAPASPLPGGGQCSGITGELDPRLVEWGYTSLDEAITHLGKMLDDQTAFDGLAALIAELKEAREALIAVKVSADHMPPMSSTRRIEWRIKSFNPAIALVRAFLARNGKGEG